MALQQEIIQALGAKPAIDANEEIRRSVDFLKAYLSAHPFLKTLVLGISGGQDSTLAGKLSQIPSPSCVTRPVTPRCNLLPYVCRMACKPTSRTVRMRLRLFSRTVFLP